MVSNRRRFRLFSAHGGVLRAPAAAGYNFPLPLGWLAILFRQILAALIVALMPQDSLLLHAQSA